MSTTPVSTRALYRILPLDFAFTLVVPGVLALSLGVPNPWTTTTVGLVACLARTLLWISILRSLLAPIDAWEATRRRSDGQSFLEALKAARSAHPRFVAAYSALWAAAMAAELIHAMHFDPDAGALSPRFPIVALLTGSSIVIGAGVLAYTVSGAILTELCVPVAVESRKRGAGALRTSGSMRFRIAMLAMGFAAAPLGWLTGIGYVAVDAAAGDKAESAARTTVMAELASATHYGRGAEHDTEVFRVTSGTPTNAPRDVVEWAESASSQDRVGSRLDRSLDRAVAFGRMTDGTTLIAITRVSTAPATALLIAAACFFIAILLWAPMSSLFYGRDMADGILRVTRAAGRVVEVGDLSKMEPLPELASDELGELTAHFNTLVDRLRELASGSLKVADGALDVSIEGEGELPSAFRGMLANLRDLVGQIRSTAVQLASAAAEIYSASQEQEAAASQQSAGIGEVSRTVDSLSEAAGHIAESAGAVLGDAERTRATTDQMIARIGDLNAHAGRIGELLESIREVADRSDLLALNGSLEATRAGEAGRGFALVAGEMRRLAERVTATVEDVRGLVGDIRSSGASTVMATEHSRKLAESTTDAARRISLVTQQQRTAMEQVSASVREIAEVLAQAAAATTQTRVSTEDLKAQADKLDTLLRRFQLDDRTAA
jgi:methyl-accepting chemotaxis protein